MKYSYCSCCAAIGETCQQIELGIDTCNGCVHLVEIDIPDFWTGGVL